MTFPLSDLWFAIREDDSGQLPARRSSRDVDQGEFYHDDTLAARVRAGDRAAFDELIATYAPDAIQLAALMLGDRDVADDVAQDVFAHLWINRATWFVRGTLRGYLMRAVANRVRNVRRMHVTHSRLEAHGSDLLTPLPLDSEATADAARADTALWEATLALPERWREAVLLRYVQRLSFAEVGTVMQISEDASKKLVRRAIAALRAKLVE